MTPPVRFTARAEQLLMKVHDRQLGESFHHRERRLFDRAAAREGLVSLTHADMHAFPPPESAELAHADAVHDAVNAFSGFLGDDQIRQMLAPRISEFLGVEVDAERELAITPGTQNALFSVLSLLVEPGKTVLLPDQEYMTLEKTIRYLGGDIAYVATRSTAGSLRMSLDDIRLGFEAGSRLLVFSHPCNPTGTVYDRYFIEGLARLVVEFDAYVLVDELYARLVFDVPFTHLAAQPSMKDRCITTLGTSKTESMSGYRVGCVVAPPEVIDSLFDVIEVTALRASMYSQFALRDWLADDQEFIDARVAQLRRLRDLTVDYLTGLPFIDLVVPDGTSYVFPRVLGTQYNDFDLAEELVERAGLLVYPGIAFGPAGIGSFRLCFAQDEDKYPDLLDRLGASLAELCVTGQGRSL